MGVDGRKAWAAWVAREIGGDAIRRDAALTAAMNALAAGRSPEEAANAGRMAAGVPMTQPAAPAAPTPQQFAPVAGGPLVCRFCSSTPAIRATIHEHNGYLIMFQHKRLPGPYCRSCGISVLRRMTNATLLRGWLGIFSFFIAPVTVLINAVTWLRIRALPPRVEGPVAPLDQGTPLYTRPGLYVYSVAMIGLVAFFAYSNVGPKGCYSDLNTVQTAVVKAHDDEATRVNSDVDQFNSCASIDCAHQAAVDAAQAYDDFNSALRPICFSSKASAHADALIKANDAAVTSVRAVAQADNANIDAAIADFNQKKNAAHDALLALYSDLDVAIASPK